MFTADQVWGLAVRADDVNMGYLKEDKWVNVDDTMVKTNTANKLMVKAWLREGDMPSEDQIAKGREYRRFFNTYTMKALMGGLSDFDQQALRIAQMDEFTARNMLEFAIISCLPATARREQDRTELKREVYSSEQLVGDLGEVVVGDIEVISTRYSQEYSKWRINARMGESFVDFWFGKEYHKGDTLRIKGKIKAQRGDKTTQLNFVKKV